MKPRRPYLISAETHQEAEFLARENNLTPGEWAFVTDYFGDREFRGYHLRGRGGYKNEPHKLIGYFSEQEKLLLTR
jgi:hypothetical protein